MRASRWSDMLDLQWNDDLGDNADSWFWKRRLPARAKRVQARILGGDTENTTSAAYNGTRSRLRLKHRREEHRRVGRRLPDHAKRVRARPLWREKNCEQSADMHVLQ